MDWLLEPGKYYRLWYRDRTPMSEPVMFECVVLHLQKLALPRLETSPPLPITDVWLQFRYPSGFEMVVSPADLEGCGLELVDDC